MKKFLDGKLLCATKNNLLIYKKGYLLFCNLNEPEKVIKQVKIQGLCGKINALARLLRLEPRCAIALDNENFLISFKGIILHYSTVSNSLIEEHRFEKGMNNPLSFCIVTLKSGEKEIYYGEYIWNTEKGPVAIYKRKDGEWSKIFEFPANSITHIHNIIYDDVRDLFYILTGDEDNESGIWVADREFKKVQVLIKGKQQYRSCVAFISNDYLYYATDTPLETNHIYRVSIKKRSDASVERVCEIPGSCIYGTSIGNRYYLSTTVEPDSSLPSWRYRITSKLGKGIKDRYSHIILIDEDGTIKECKKLKKDIWPMWLMQFGNVLFPYNETQTVYFTTQAVSPGHAQTFYLDEDEIC